MAGEQLKAPEQRLCLFDLSVATEECRRSLIEAAASYAHLPDHTNDYILDQATQTMADQFATLTNFIFADKLPISETRRLIEHFQAHEDHRRTEALNNLLGAPIIQPMQNDPQLTPPRSYISWTTREIIQIESEDDMAAWEENECALFRNNLLCDIHMYREHAAKMRFKTQGNDSVINKVLENGIGKTYALLAFAGVVAVKRILRKSS
jgi:hypothetical protein